MEDKDPLAVDPLETVALDGLEKFTYISSLLSNKEKEQLQCVLLRNIDMLAYNHLNMTRIDPMLASHKLNVIPSTKPVRQKVRCFHSDYYQIIQTEVDNLLRSGFVREVKYPKWLANVVVVPKKDGKWRVCVDYTDLNEACLKDNFPLPRIDHIVDASSGHGMLSFLDAFSGYHHIPMHPPDGEKMAFITPHGLYCYNVMPFGLKNAGATYQRLVTKIFQPLIGKTMEVYIDDMFVKSKERTDHTKHLQETFELLRTYNMKLDPLKCVVGVDSVKFLGFTVMKMGVEVNPFSLELLWNLKPLPLKIECNN